jgi:hypothetical protein
MLVVSLGLEPRYRVSRTRELPIIRQDSRNFLAHLAGFEPATLSLTGSRSAVELQMNVGGPGETRTLIPSLKRRVLYAIELLTQNGGGWSNRTASRFLKRVTVFETVRHHCLLSSMLAEGQGFEP